MQNICRHFRDMFSWENNHCYKFQLIWRHKKLLATSAHHGAWFIINNFEDSLPDQLPYGHRSYFSIKFYGFYPTNSCRCCHKKEWWEMIVTNLRWWQGQPTKRSFSIFTMDDTAFRTLIPEAFLLLLGSLMYMRRCNLSVGHEVVSFLTSLTRNFSAI